MQANRPYSELLLTRSVALALHCACVCLCTSRFQRARPKNVRNHIQNAQPRRTKGAIRVKSVQCDTPPTLSPCDTHAPSLTCAMPFLSMPGKSSGCARKCATNADNDGYVTLLAWTCVHATRVTVSISRGCVYTSVWGRARHMRASLEHTQCVTQCLACPMRHRV